MGLTSAVFSDDESQETSSLISPYFCWKRTLNFNQPVTVNCCCNGAYVEQWHSTGCILYCWHFRFTFENNAQKRCQTGWQNNKWRKRKDRNHSLLHDCWWYICTSDVNFPPERTCYRVCSLEHQLELLDVQVLMVGFMLKYFSNGYTISSVMWSHLPLTNILLFLMVTAATIQVIDLARENGSDILVLHSSATAIGHCFLQALVW